MENKIVEQFRVILRFSRAIFFIGLLMTGCVRLRPTPAPAPQRVAILPVALTGGVQVAVQYAHSTAKRMGYNTAEIYLENHSANTVMFQSAFLNGEKLPTVRTKAASSLDLVTLDGETMPLVDTMLPSERDVVWWQFYLSPELKPGETIICQINFRGMPTFQRKLELKDMSGKSYEVTVPRFRQPETLITAITFPLDYSKIYIQYQSKHVPPARLWLNNREVVGFTVLPSSEPDTPDMLMVPCNAPDAQFPITTGMPLHVKLQFPNGTVRQELVRAQNGITLDGWFKQRPSDKELKDLGLDKEPAMALMAGFDVTCQDVRMNDKGACAPAVVTKRLAIYEKQQMAGPSTGNQRSEIGNSLWGLASCSAMYPELWNCYSQIVDFFTIKPYRLGWGHNPARFIEEEEECMEQAQTASRPRPLMWIPERFHRKGRYLEPEEMRVMAWMMLARGGKGIRYHFWMNPGPDPFAGCPLLLPALKEQNREIRAHVSELSPLALVSERTVAVSNQSSTNSQQPSPIKIYTAWSGDQGILVMIRNLDYQTDAKADDEGRSPRFHAIPKTDMTIPVMLPDWFRVGSAKDLLTAQSVSIVKRKKNIELKMKHIDAFTLIWFENKQSDY